VDSRNVVSLEEQVRRAHALAKSVIAFLNSEETSPLREREEMRHALDAFLGTERYRKRKRVDLEQEV
jgi:hypothetical protein